MDLCTDISRECCNCDQGQASGCPCGQSGCPSCCQSHCTDMIHYPVAMSRNRVWYREPFSLNWIFHFIAGGVAYDELRF